jgi:LacI family transcriptional regulator
VGADKGALRRLGLIYDGRRAFDRKVMTGVAAWLREHQGFCLHVDENPLTPGFGPWDLDGIIANVDDQIVAKAVTASRLPAVGFGTGFRFYKPEPPTPYLFPSGAGIANLAADHFVACGLRHFGYSGYTHTSLGGWSKAREDAFAVRLAEQGFKCSVWLEPMDEARPSMSPRGGLTAWLRSLPKRTGIMAADDVLARRILEACRDSGIDVPGEIAVIGVDNDELLCGLGVIALTSIEPDALRIGYEAAELLDNIMRGKKPGQLNVEIEPAGIVGRQSTESAIVRDRVVAKAMAIIQEGISGRIRVSEVARALAISRPSLEGRFKTEFGETVHGMMRKIQLERAKRLVADSDLPLKQVAVSTGFRSVQYMTTLFRREFGHPPAIYRHRARL